MSGSPTGSINPWLRPTRALVIAHRGHSIEVPENTIEAFRRAIELGAEMIEADVNITSDGQLVMIHDTTLDRTTSGHGRVSAATWEELTRLDAGAWFGEAFVGHRIPTVDETIELARDAGIWMCFEIKGHDHAEAERIAEPLITLLVARDALGFAAISGYDHDVLALAKRRVPELVLAPERLPDSVPVVPATALAQATRLEAPILQNHYRFLTDELVETLHAAGVAVWSWTINEEAEIVGSIARRADGLMGDDVRLIVEVVDRGRVPAV